MSFGQRLRSLREKAGLTQAALAELAGVPLRTVQGWEQDYRCPVSPDFFKLARALGVSADEFSAELAFTGPAAPGISPGRGRPPKEPERTAPAEPRKASSKPAPKKARRRP
jgi:transcriptional regulator with XRE-family HTH domain